MSRPKRARAVVPRQSNVLMAFQNIHSVDTRCVESHWSVCSSSHKYTAYMSSKRDRTLVNVLGIIPNMIMTSCVCTVTYRPLYKTSHSLTSYQCLPVPMPRSRRVPEISFTRCRSR